MKYRITINKFSSVSEIPDAWNNSGTGHSAFCELNYTPFREDGSVDLTKALRIAEQFEVSKQFWAHLKENGDLPNQQPFINDIPHMSFVWGDENLRFLKERYFSMTAYPIFHDMEYTEEREHIETWVPLTMNPFPMFEDMIYTEDLGKIAEWLPLMMDGREVSEPLAVTRMDIGTDVNFGALTREMIAYLQTCDNVEIHLGHEVQDLTHLKDGRWKIDMEDLHNEEEKSISADYVFLGAGGGSLTLLEKSDIPEGQGYGGFPVSGQFLKCTNPEVVLQHEAKVYGKASVGAPPMSVPHLDTRMLDGVRSLLFGPYAGFSTKFLKNGSYLDLPLSIEMHNVWPMLSAGIHNIALTKYLISQVMQSPEDRFKALQVYYPEAKIEDWELTIAGQRVQIIKKDNRDGGVLKFGTEIVCAADGSLSALLGASPGASTSVSIMLNVLEKMFPNEMKSENWKKEIKAMIPTYGQSLIDNADLCMSTRKRTTDILKLED